jgi:hypothetical protein
VIAPGVRLLGRHHGDLVESPLTKNVSLEYVRSVETK